MRRRLTILSAMAASLLAAVMPARATMLEKFDLGDMTSRADAIFRGTVIDVEQGSITAGGGELPMVTYTLKVEEMLKGEADVVKEGGSLMTVRMVGSIKAATPMGARERFSVFRDVPKLTRGGDYVLFMTPRSEIGLSVTVGLGQGAFNIVRTTKEDMAVNAFDNAGLGLGDGGPVTYDSLKAAVLSASGQ